MTAWSVTVPPCEISRIRVVQEQDNTNKINTLYKMILYKQIVCLVDDEMNQQVFIMDLSFNPEITDELMVIYFDLNKEIFCITHES